MKFGLLHFFEQAAGGKSERQIVREQLDSMRNGRRDGVRLYLGS